MRFLATNEHFIEAIGQFARADSVPPTVYKIKLSEMLNRQTFGGSQLQIIFLSILETTFGA